MEKANTLPVSINTYYNILKPYNAIHFVFQAKASLKLPCTNFDQV